MNIPHDGRQPSFEEVYPRAPYVELIRQALALAGWLRGFHREAAALSPRASRPAGVTPSPSALIPANQGETR